MATSSSPSQRGHSTRSPGSIRCGVGVALGLGDLDVQRRARRRAPRSPSRGPTAACRACPRVLDLAGALALLGPGHDHGRAAVDVRGLGERAVDLVDVVAVDLDRVPAEGPCAVGVGVEIPAVHRLAGLAEPVDVDDRGQVVEAVVCGVLERLPDRSLGHLAVAAQDPYAVGQLIEALAGERDADADRQSLAERAGRHVHPRQHRRGVALEAAAEPPERQQLLVGDRTGGLQEAVVERRGVSLGEDQVVVARVVRAPEVVVQVLGEQHGHQVGGGHRRGRVARAGGVAAPDGVNAELLAELA